MNQNIMKEKKVLPLLLSMSLPMVLSMLINSLYNIVDSYYVAQINENAMTALSLVYPIQNFIGAIAIGFGIGINAIIAIYLGMEETHKAHISASMGMLFSLIHSFLLTIICLLCMPYFLKIFHADASTTTLALQYTHVVFSFTPILIMGITFEKIFQSIGAMKISMIAMMCGCLLNIILDPLMIFTFQLGIHGAAWATGIGQTCTLLIYLYFYFFKPMPLKIHPSYCQFDSHVIKKMYAVGIPATLNLALPSLLISVLNIILSSYSATYVLILGIYYKLQTFLYLPANGIIQGMRPLIGFNYGAGEWTRVKRIYQLVLVMSATIMGFGTLICFFIPSSLIGLFSNNPHTISLGATALRIISLGFITSSLSVTSSGALEGLGKGIPSLIISLCRYTIIIIPLAYVLSIPLKANGVWWAFALTELITALISIIVYKKALSAH